MVTHARTGVAALLIGCVLVMSQLVLISPASAASPVGPDWVPAQSALPSSAFPNDPQFKALLADRMFYAASQAGSPIVEATHLANQTAAARGAYVPGLSDVARAKGVSPHAISAAQAGPAYSSYVTRPGSGSMIVGTANSRGVVSVSNVGKGVGFAKAGKAFAAVTGPTALVGMVGWEIGTAVGGGLVNIIGLPTSGSIVCDFMTAVSESDCGLVKHEDYTVNADVTATQPGFGSTPWWPYHVYARKTSGGQVVQLGDVVISTTAEAVNSVTLREQFVGTVAVTAEAPQYVSYDGYCLLPTGSIVNQGSFNTRIRAHNLSPVVDASRTFTCSNGVLDHVTITWSSIDTERYVTPLFDPTSVVATYYAPTSPNRPTDVEADPVRQWRTSWECTTGETGNQLSATYRESDPVWAVPPQASCTSGEVRKLKVEQITVGLPDEVVYEWELPGETQAFLEEFPDCGLGQCVLDLRTTKTGVETSCFQSPELCTDWLHDPERDTNFQCYYADTKVAMSECFLYGPTFNKTEVEKNSPYGDPETGEPLVPTAPGAGGGGDGGPPEDPNCPPPFSVTSVLKPWWYYKGLECGLRWAFVPSGVGGVTSGIFGAYEASAASGLVGSTKELLSIPMNGQCGVLFSVQPSVFGGQTFSVDTCSEFWTGAAPIRSLLGVSMVLLATIAGVRIALTSLGVTMFDGKGSP